MNDLQAHMIAGLARGTRRGPLPLLPSGPGGVHGLPLREARLSSPPAGGATNKNGGERGIRTLGTLLTYTRFPGVLLQPLGHLSIRWGILIQLFLFVYTLTLKKIKIL